MPPRPGLTLPPCRRIKSRAEFEQALQAHCLSNRWFSVYVRKNEHGFARLGVIASKRTMPKAITRNYAKRMIREVFRCNFLVDYPLDVIVRAKQQFKPETAAEGRLALIHLFQSVQK